MTFALLTRRTHAPRLIHYEPRFIVITCAILLFFRLGKNDRITVIIFLVIRLPGGRRENDWSSTRLGFPCELAIISTFAVARNSVKIKRAPRAFS